MDKDFWRENWPLFLFGGVGLFGSMALLSHQTGQPLLPQFDFRAMVAPLVPGLVAILRAGVTAIGILLVVLLAFFTLIPIRDWFVSERKRLAKQSKLKINDYRKTERAQEVAPGNSWIEQKEKRDYSTLYLGVASLLDRHAGGHRAATVEGLLQELERALATPKATPAVAAPSASDWRLIAQLVKWARGADSLRLRATRDAFRTAKIAVPEADVQKGGAFNEWVMGLAPPSPITPEVSVADEKQATDHGQDDGRTEKVEQEHREGRGAKSNDIAKYLVPRIARKRVRPERNELT